MTEAHSNSDLRSLFDSAGKATFAVFGIMTAAAAVAGTLGLAWVLPAAMPVAGLVSLRLERGGRLRGFVWAVGAMAFTWWLSGFVPLPTGPDWASTLRLGLAEALLLLVPGFVGGWVMGLLIGLERRKSLVRSASS